MPETLRLWRLKIASWNLPPPAQNTLLMVTFKGNVHVYTDKGGNSSEINSFSNYFLLKQTLGDKGIKNLFDIFAFIAGESVPHKILYDGQTSCASDTSFLGPLNRSLGGSILIDRHHHSCTYNMETL